MRIAYLDCPTGISGDMTLGALIDAGVDAGAIRAAVDSLNLPGVELKIATVIKGGFKATKVDVEHPEQHAHRHLADVVKIIDAGELTDSRRQLAKAIFSAVAEAEAKVHGSSIEKVHFHEVGAIDSIIDIIGAAVGFDLLGADEIVCSPLPTGRGKIKIDHGVCAIPAPGTAELLKGIPLADVPVEGELTTPTGAAIVKVLANRFAALPAMTIEAIGYGAGTMDIPGRANLLRLFVGEAKPTDSAAWESDRVVLLETNLDDVTGEVVGYAKRKLLEAGALDVYSTAIQMKKDRPGVIVSVIAAEAEAEKLEAILFEESGTFGVRRTVIERSKRARAEHSVQTPWGEVTGKLGQRSADAAIFIPEFESCARVAEAHGVPLREIYRSALAAFDVSGVAVAEEVTPKDSTPHTHDHDHDHDHSHDQDHDH